MTKHYHYCNYCRDNTYTVGKTDCEICGLAKTNFNLEFDNGPKPKVGKGMSAHEMATNWKNSRRELSNALYADISVVLDKYEAKGFNSHARTQNLVENLLTEADDWINKQIHSWRVDSK